MLYPKPWYRVASGLVWFGGLILIFLNRTQIEIDEKKYFYLIIITLSISAAFIMLQNFINGDSVRPRAFFSEASYAGLSLYAASAGLLACMLSVPSKKRKLIFGLASLIFYYSATLTKSLHILTFFLVFTFIFFSKTNIKYFLKYFSVILIFFTIFFLTQDDLNHYISRFESQEVNGGNLSMLAWMNGASQSISALKINFFTGLGLGSTGFFEYQSPYIELLTNKNQEGLNKYDAYSALFRINIEMGIIFSLCLIFFIILSIKEIKLILSDKFHDDNYGYLLFISVFSSVLVLGVLIKEPTYSRSFVYVGWILFLYSIRKCNERKMTT